MLRPGDKAPEFQLPTLAGKLSSLASFRDRGPVLVAFFKVSCPVCQYTFPFLERIAASGRIPVIGVSQDDAADTQDFADAHGLNFPMLIDGIASGYAVSAWYRITNVPTIFLVEQEGTISAAWTGFSRRDLEELGHRIAVSPFREGEKIPEFTPG